MPRIAKISKSELMKLQKTFLIDKAIGKKLGITKQAVHQMRQRYGIPRLPATAWKSPFTARIPKNELMRLQKTLITDKAIGKKYGVSLRSEKVGSGITHRNGFQKIFCEVGFLRATSKKSG